MQVTLHQSSSYFEPGKDVTYLEFAECLMITEKKVKNIPRGI